MSSSSAISFTASRYWFITDSLWPFTVSANIAINLYLLVLWIPSSTNAGTGIQKVTLPFLWRCVFKGDNTLALHQFLLTASYHDEITNWLEARAFEVCNNRLIFYLDFRAICCFKITRDLTKDYLITNNSTRISDMQGHLLIKPLPLHESNDQPYYLPSVSGNIPDIVGFCTDLDLKRTSLCDPTRYTQTYARLDVTAQFSVDKPTIHVHLPIPSKQGPIFSLRIVVYI